MPRTSWQPANDVERRMRQAWDQGDADAFADLLMESPLFLPGFEVDAEGRQRLLTRSRGGQTFLLVFTSVEALREAVGTLTTGWRQTSFAELAAALPDPTWGLAVSPHTPIGAYLGPEQVRAMAAELPDEPVFHAATEKERLMRAAQQEGVPAIYLNLLVVSDVLLAVDGPAVAADLGRPEFPWRVTYVDGLPTVSAFTSPRRVREGFPEGVPTVEVGMVKLVRAWPDPRYRLAVNPGSAIASVFTGAQVPDLLQWAYQVAASAPVGDVQPLEVTVAQNAVDLYLGDGYDRVSGPVRAAGTGGDPFGYLVRWYGDPAAVPPGQTVTDLVLPHGAQLIRVTAGEEMVMGSYDAELHRWNPAIADALRGFLT
jgi:hypothetical protein